MGKQAWYNNVIAVCPTDPNLVLAAGVSMMRSENGGATWTKIEDPHVHGDFHALQWHPNGLWVWAGHDGGWCWSNDQGREGTWSSDSNRLPITQFTGFDITGFGWFGAGICGGTQDNGVFATANGGADWFQIAGGDGGDCIYTGLGASDILFACGWIDGARAFDRYRSVDGGASFTPFITGLDESPAWYPSMRKDGDGRIFTHDHQWVYGLSPQEDRWIKLHNGPFAVPITEITVTPVPINFVVWVCMSDYLGAWGVAVYDGDGFYDRSGGLPPGIGVRKVVPHPYDPHRAYALLDGLNTPGHKIYMTTDLGQSWTNITGDLPNVPLADLIVHLSDDNRLFVGSEYGLYRTVDGGANWFRWNNGMPEAACVTEMKLYNVGAGVPVYDIVASTYGRGIWRRSMHGEDEPSAVSDGTPAGG